MDPMRTNIAPVGAARTHEGVARVDEGQLQAAEGVAASRETFAPAPRDVVGTPPLASSPPAHPTGDAATTAVSAGMAAPGPVTSSSIKWVEGPIMKAMREAMERGQ